MARNVVISGGGTGIGLAAAQVFAAEGDRVLLLGRRAEVLEKAGVPGALTYAADLAEADQVRGVVGFVERELGAVDVLIHSAGGTGQLEPLADVSDPLDAVAHNWTDSSIAACRLSRVGERGVRGGQGGGCIRTPMIWPGSWGRGGSRRTWSRRATSRTRSSSVWPLIPLGGSGLSVTG